MNTLATSFSGGQYTNQAAMLLYSSGAQRPMGVVIALGETPWELAMTVLPFLGRWGMKIQEAYHGVCTVHTNGQVSNYSNASSWRSPQHLTAPPNRISSIVLLNLPTSPGRQVYISNSEKSVSRLAAVLWRVIKSNSAPYYFFPRSHRVHTCNCCPAYSTSTLNYTIS